MTRRVANRLKAAPPRKHNRPTRKQSDFACAVRSSQSSSSIPVRWLAWWGTRRELSELRWVDLGRQGAGRGAGGGRVGRGFRNWSLKTQKLWMGIADCSSDVKPARILLCMFIRQKQVLYQGAGHEGFSSLSVNWSSCRLQKKTQPNTTHPMYTHTCIKTLQLYTYTHTHAYIKDIHTHTSPYTP